MSLRILLAVPLLLVLAAPARAQATEGEPLPGPDVAAESQRFRAQGRGLAWGGLAVAGGSVLGGVIIANPPTSASCGECMSRTFLGAGIGLVGVTVGLALEGVALHKFSRARRHEVQVSASGAGIVLRF